MFSDPQLISFLDQEIAKKGSLSLHDYMALCLQHPQYGYYIRGNPLGHSGDFITAPEMSQLFGESIAFFLISHLDILFPEGYSICELGAGRGTLMADMLRILNKKTPPENCYILESNSLLKTQQIKNIPHVNHIDSLDDLPQKPLFFIANEFFDALPIHSYKLAGSEKFEMHITGKKGVYELNPTHRSHNETKRHQGIYETCPDAHHIMEQIADHIKRYKGSGIFCDYGYIKPRDTISFRGYHKHKVTNGLTHPFEEDLTADIDFTALSNTASHMGVKAYPVVTQKHFLAHMHIELRLHKLLGQSKDLKQSQIMIEAVRKLTDASEMGEKFKFLFISHLNSDIYPFNMT